MWLEPEVFCNWAVVERHRDAMEEVGRGLTSVSQGENLDFTQMKDEPSEYFKQWSGKVELTCLKY